MSPPVGEPPERWGETGKEEEEVGGVRVEVTASPWE